MSVSSDLQSALNCANKCDCCKKLQQQINVLNNKVGGLDQDIKNIIPRVNNHEKRISDNEKKISRFKNTNRNSRNNYSYQDLRKIKQQIAAIERYINIVDSAGKALNGVLIKFLKTFFK